MKSPILAPTDKIEKYVCNLRKRKVVLDHHLAALYGIPAKDIKSVVKRNMSSFPPEIMFSLNKTELDNLQPRINTVRSGGMRYAPLAFTAEGVKMLSNILDREKNHSV